jgi:DNA-binding response OmpR family regulator
MTLESLLLTGDADVIRILRPSLESLSIDVEICQEARKAVEILVSEKFDAVIVDCDDLPGGLEVLQGLRTTPSNRSSVAFALLNGKRTTTQEAFDMGVNFVLQKPIGTLNAARCFNAALNFMVREQRRYFRHPTKMVVTVAMGEKKLKATSTNISEGGMALLLHEALPRSCAPRLQFTLPETNLTLDVDGELAWADLEGRVGLRFSNLPEKSRELLERWLDQQMKKQLPGSKAKLATSGSEIIQ